MPGRNIPRRTPSKGFEDGLNAIVKQTETQSERFKRAARELECDESEERFNAAVKTSTSRSQQRGGTSGAFAARGKMPTVPALQPLAVAAFLRMRRTRG